MYTARYSGDELVHKIIIERGGLLVFLSLNIFLLRRRLFFWGCGETRDGRVRDYMWCRCEACTLAAPMIPTTRLVSLPALSADVRFASASDFYIFFFVCSFCCPQLAILPS